MQARSTVCSLKSFTHLRQQAPVLSARQTWARSARQIHTQRYHARRIWKFRSTAVFAAAATIAVLYQHSIPQVLAEAPKQDGDIEFRIEKPKKKKGASKEENRDLISSQHLQVKRSWENPGVYAWGSNTGKVAAPDSEEAYVKTPRRIAYFDDLLLRDIKLDRQSGAAVLENGDLVQWGKGYSEDVTGPVVTLKGKDLKSVTLSKDRVIALSHSGSVYSLPISQSDQASGYRPSESSWIPLWSNTSSVAYRKLTPPNLSYREKVIEVSSGLEHVLLLTNSGRVFSAASSSEAFPSKGQLGVPGLNFLNRPQGTIDQPHELTTLRGFNLTQIATGDYHSVVLDEAGRVFSFGDNTSGQLGFEYSSEAPFVDNPSLVNTTRLYQGTNQTPYVTSIKAGGSNTFFTVDATRKLGLNEDPQASDVKTLLGRITADTWSCGQGIRGTLGNGKWTHMQTSPAKIPSLSGLYEYDERKNTVIPIRLAQISVGSTHASAVMDNVTYLDASEKSSENDTNWGADVLWWGGNEYYQLGTGKRNNVAQPIYLRPLDMEAEVEMGRREEHRFHLTPRHTVRVGKSQRKVSMEQRVECGRNVTAVYSGV